MYESGSSTSISYALAATCARMTRRAELLSRRGVAVDWDAAAQVLAEMALLDASEGDLLPRPVD